MCYFAPRLFILRKCYFLTLFWDRIIERLIRYPDVPDVCWLSLEARRNNLHCYPCSTNTHKELYQTNCTALLLWLCVCPLKVVWIQAIRMNLLKKNILLGSILTAEPSRQLFCSLDRLGRVHWWRVLLRRSRVTLQKGKWKRSCGPGHHHSNLRS